MTFLDVLVRQNDLVYTKTAFHVLSQVQNFHFFKNVAYIYFEEEKLKKNERGTNYSKKKDNNHILVQ